MENMTLVYLSLLAFLTALILTQCVRRYALRHNILDNPNERSSHSIPTPRGGGIAIVATFSLANLLLWTQGVVEPALSIALIVGGILISVLGWCDDVYNIRPKVRALCQFIVGGLALMLLGGLPILDFGTWQFNYPFICSLIGLISIVWLTNLYNFMDGIDGLAGGEGLFVCLAGFITLYYMGEASLAAIFLLLGASILGFLIFNWPPAKIFLGDVGSSYIGYVIAILGIYCSKTTALTLSYWIILLSVFICDATFTVVRRTSQGKAWYIGHREHAYQHLTSQRSHRVVTESIMVFNVGVIMPLAVMAAYWPSLSGWIMLGTVFMLYLLWKMISRQPRESVA